MFLNIAGNTCKSTIVPSPQQQSIQPNAVDIDIDVAYKIYDTIFTIDNSNNKTHRDRQKIQCDQDGFWFFVPGVYEFSSTFNVQIAEQECGWLITRSTFVRNGCFVTSGLYDSGYNGIIGGVLHVCGGPVKIQRHSRIAQFVLTDSESIGLYGGNYH